MANILGWDKCARARYIAFFKLAVATFLLANQSIQAGVESNLRQLDCEALFRGEWALIHSPLSSGGIKFAPKLAELGIPSAYLIGPDRLSFTPPEPFSRWFRRIEDTHQLGGLVFDHERDIEGVGNAIRLGAWGTQPSLILPGGETAVESMEELMRFFQYPKRNDDSKPRARWDKWDMHLALKEAGLPTIRQHLADKVEILLEWRKKELKEWPVILKPRNSVGTDQVILCRNEEEVRAAFSAIHGRTNRNGKMNNEVLMQERLDVTEFEFIVDTVSSNGIHKTFIIGQYHRFLVPGSAYLLSGGDLLRPRYVHTQLLENYGKMFLDALGVRFGPAHMEIVLVRRNGLLVPLLLDFGARLAGTFPSLGEAATGQNVVEWTILSHRSPEAFAKLPDVAPLQKQAGFITLHAHRDGSRMAERSHAETVRLLREVHQVKSLHNFFPVFEPGTPLQKTHDLTSMPIIIELAHESAQQLSRDRAKIRELDRAEFFVTSP